MTIFFVFGSTTVFHFLVLILFTRMCSNFNKVKKVNEYKCMLMIILVNDYEFLTQMNLQQGSSTFLNVKKRTYKLQ